MVPDTTKQVTVDRISNSGNPIAKETHNGKTIHVPSGLTEQTHEVRLEDRGSYVVAHLVHRESGLRSRGPTGPSSPSSGDKGLQEIAKELTQGESITMEQRECSDTRLAPNEYPGKSHRSEIASRHD